MRAERVWQLAPVLALAVALAACPDPDPTEPVEQLDLVTALLPVGVVGEPYSEGLDVEGGDGEYSWTLASGALPPGLALSVEDLVDNDALITGIPTQPGTYSFAVQVSSGDGQSRTRDYTIQVSPAPSPITIRTVVIPPALVGAPYETYFQATGGSGEGFIWSLVGGTVPPGLTLREDGRLRGVPTEPDTVVLVLRAESGGLDAEKAFTLQVVANRGGTFDITAVPVVPVPAALQPALDAAFERWQGAIVGNLQQAAIPPDFFTPDQCGGFGSILNGTSADDVIVLVNITRIDGPGAILGQAGPCVLRSNNVPFAGRLTLDADDLMQMTPARVTDLMVHEIGHVLGFGSVWTRFGLVSISADDPRFTGSNAVAHWQALGGAGNVPVENQGGEGTARSHWREAVFDTELMTGFAEPAGTPQPLSRMSIASMADMGYQVNLDAADAFVLAPPMSPAAAAADRAEAPGWDEVFDEAVYRIEDDGSTTILRRDP